MNTYRELVYMVLDELKGMSDDFSYTEDHIVYLLEKYRAFILNNDKNPITKADRANLQTITFDVSLERELLSYDLNIDDFKLFYISDIKIPHLIACKKPLLYVKNYYDDSIDLINAERMLFVGYNKFLKRFKYASISTDHHLHLVYWKHLDYTPKFTFKELMKRLLDLDEQNFRIANKELSRLDIPKEITLTLTAVFLSPKEVIKLMNPDAEILDEEFPIDNSLVPMLILSVMKELLGASYRPEDDTNNAKDDLSDFMSYIRRNMKSKLSKEIEDGE